MRSLQEFWEEFSEVAPKVPRSCVCGAPGSLTTSQEPDPEPPLLLNPPNSPEATAEVSPAVATALLCLRFRVLQTRPWGLRAHERRGRLSTSEAKPLLL